MDAFQELPVAAWLVGPDGGMVDANPAACELLGIDRDELRARNVYELLHEGDQKGARSLVRGSPGARGVHRCRIRRADGRSIPIEFRWRVLPHGQALVVLEDLGHLAEAEDQLVQREREFRAIFEHAASGKVLLDAAGRFLRVNRAFEEICGRPRAGLLVGARLPDLVHPDDRVRDDEVLARAARGAIDDFRLESRLLRPDGAERWVLYAAAALRDSSGGFLHTVVTITDITERRRAEDALKEAARRKDEFLAVLSHELRNPLAPIRTGLQVLQRVALDTDQARRTLSIIERQTRHLTRLVDDLLDVTRISRGRISLRRHPADLVELVRATTEDLRDLFVAHELDLELSLPSEEAVGLVDEVRIAQVVGNLVHNAVKFTPAGGRVHVSLEREDDLAILKVVDTGVGIEPDLLPVLFEPFTQADSSLDRSKGGLGLGLALVRGLVELHGGEVAAYSEGQGAELVVKLPLA